MISSPIRLLPALLLITAFWTPGTWGADSTVTAEPVDAIRRTGEKPAAWYRAQAGAWERVVAARPGDVDAWWHYYLATAYATRGGAPEARRTRLGAIVDHMADWHPDRAETHLARCILDPGDTLSARRALQLDPDNPDVYYHPITTAELSRDTTRFTELLAGLHATGDLDPALLDYAFNTLVSTAPDALVFTNGDNDTYPAWMLQEVHGIRPDVTILNLHLARTRPRYLARRLAEEGFTIDATGLPGDPAPFLSALLNTLYRQDPHRPLYTALTVDDGWLKAVRRDLYVVGLTARFSPRRIDNMTVLLDRFAPAARLDYLRHDWQHDRHTVAPEILDRLNLNYVPAFVMLAEHHQAAGDSTAAGRWRALARRVASAGERGAELETVMKQRGIQ